MQPARVVQRGAVYAADAKMPNANAYIMYSAILYSYTSTCITHLRASARHTHTHIRKTYDVPDITFHGLLTRGTRYFNIM